MLVLWVPLCAAHSPDSLVTVAPVGEGAAIVQRLVPRRTESMGEAPAVTGMLVK